MKVAGSSTALPLSEVWSQLDGDDTARRRQLGEIVAQRAQALVAAGRKLIPTKLQQLAEQVHSLEEDPGAKDHGMKVASLYSQGVQAMAAVREAFLNASPISPLAAHELVRSIPMQQALVGTFDSDEVRAYLAEAIQMAGVQGVQTLTEITAAGERAMADRSARTLNLTRYGRNRDPLRALIFHEYGHHREFTAPGVLATCASWLKQRAGGAPARPLRELIPGSCYDPGEVALPDHFVDPYVGKVYPDATEVLSMGLERLGTPRDMFRLLVGDCEHLYLVLGLLEAHR